MNTASGGGPNQDLSSNRRKQGKDVMKTQPQEVLYRTFIASTMVLLLPLHSRLIYHIYLMDYWNQSNNLRDSPALDSCIGVYLLLA